MSRSQNFICPVELVSSVTGTWVRAGKARLELELELERRLHGLDHTATHHPTPAA